MHTAKRFWRIGLLLVPLLIGCIGAQQPLPKIEYYTLEYDPPAVKSGSALPAVVRVERFQVAPDYNTTNMVYREEAFQRDAYDYEKWRANPGDFVTYFLARDLKESGRFKGVFVLSGNFPSSHVIEGILDEFYQENHEEYWEAVLSFGITLLAEYEPDISKKILFQKRYGTRKKCAFKNPNALAEAMSRAMGELSQRVISDVYQALAGMR